MSARKRLCFRAPKRLSDVIRGPFDFSVALDAAVADAKFRVESAINAAGIAGLISLETTYVETVKRYARKTGDAKLERSAAALLLLLGEMRPLALEFQGDVDASRAADLDSDSDSESESSEEEEKTASSDSDSDSDSESEAEAAAEPDSESESESDEEM